MANIIGTNGNDTLVGTNGADTINGNDTIPQTNDNNDSLTGGGGKDKFVYNIDSDYGYSNTYTITDFGGVGKGVTPSAAVIAEVDTIQFQGYYFTARNLLLTQNGSNLEITFENLPITKVILQNFKLENLDNLPATSSRPAIGNILFDGQTSITDSFDVFNANSTQTNLFNKNTVTFLNDLDNNITGFDNSDDVVNGQGGNDKIDGKSGNDLLRGGIGNDTLIGGEGDDSLFGGEGNDSLLGGGGDDSLLGGTGDDILLGGTGNDTLFGGRENDTLLGGTGDDRLTVGSSNLDTLGGDQLLSGEDGNDTLSASGYESRYEDTYYTSGNNTLNGGAGDDYLIVKFSKGNNLLNGGDGNDTFSESTTVNGTFSKYNTGNDTVDGGQGDDLLSYNSDAIRGMTSTFNPTTNVGSITIDTNQFSYKNIERLNITGTYYDDDIVGTNGNDTLNPGSSGNDTIDGGAGDDLLSYYNYSGGGTTSFFDATTNTGLITSGSNRVSYKNIERLNITSGFGDDNIVGSNGNDTLDPGKAGNDTIDGGAGDDLLSYSYNSGGAGITSTFDATTNTGLITAGTRLVSYKNIERLDITGTEYDDNIVGGNGNDTLDPGRSGDDTINGGAGDDLLSYLYDFGDGITSTFDATTNTGLITSDRNRVSYKNIERLEIAGTEYDDNIVGSNGNDRITGSYASFDAGFTEFDIISGNDIIDGGNGDDLLIVNDSGDLRGFGITSTLNAITNEGSITAGTNQVSYKNIERLDIIGTYYDDLIVGGNGNDTLNGGFGNDILIGGKGNDSLNGGSGIDTFAFNSFNEGIDRLDDFNTTNELIRVSIAGFGGGLSPGSLSANQFTIGASATTSTQRFIYNDVTGALFFDQDGSASSFTQVQFAQLSPGSSLTKNNFVVV
ncbi:calcium-binding protein [Nostoc sp. C052]|uniref:beta strand repeat-containing protein n=1 Tax=Nostoc sp. C052 TaxID=2576902 RepID=UPI0015C34FFE|nr:calcium-binding protein [Nostoc sp. C052]QLE40350.1 calcium-binding protein [Nostoc sp. C052]